MIKQASEKDLHGTGLRILMKIILMFEMPFAEYGAECALTYH